MRDLMIKEPVLRPELTKPLSRRLLPRLSVGARPHGLPPAELVKLHHSLVRLLEAKQSLITQFVAEEANPRVAAIVYDLAYLSASWLGKRVLFVDGTSMRMDADDPSALSRQERSLNGPVDLTEIESSITRVVGLGLYQMRFPSMRGALELAPTLRHVPKFLTGLRDRFDLVLIAPPAISEAPMAMLLSRFADGNILVLTAGATRAPVATEVRDSLKTAGGDVIGAVLTRYRSHIPRFLRRWM
jgi:hypothetical protein